MDEIAGLMLGESVRKQIYDFKQVDLDFDVNQYISNQIILEAYKWKKEAFKKVVMKYYEDYYRYRIEDGTYNDIIPLIKEVVDKKEKNNIKSDYLFVTVNPRPTVNITDFINICSKVITKPWIQKYLYVIEQRGANEDEVGKGFHAHFLIHKIPSKSFAHARREFESSFRKFCDTQNYHTFNFAFCKDLDIPKRQNYLVGLKADPEKHIKQEFDKKFRKIYEIPDYYGMLFIDP